MKYLNLFKIQGPGCYDINFTFPKYDLPEFCKFLTWIVMSVKYGGLSDKYILFVE